MDAYGSDPWLHRYFEDTSPIVARVSNLAVALTTTAKIFSTYICCFPRFFFLSELGAGDSEASLRLCVGRVHSLPLVFFSGVGICSFFLSLHRKLLGPNFVVLDLCSYAQRSWEDFPKRTPGTVPCVASRYPFA